MQRLRRVCPNCGPGIFMATHFNRVYWCALPVLRVPICSAPDVSTITCMLLSFCETFLFNNIEKYSTTSRIVQCLILCCGNAQRQVLCHLPAGEGGPHGGQEGQEDQGIERFSFSARLCLLSPIILLLKAQCCKLQTKTSLTSPNHFKHRT